MFSIGELWCQYFWSMVALHLDTPLSFHNSPKPSVLMTVGVNMISKSELVCTFSHCFVSLFFVRMFLNIHFLLLDIILSADAFLSIMKGLWIKPIYWQDVMTMTLFLLLFAFREQLLCSDVFCIIHCYKFCWLINILSWCIVSILWDEYKHDSMRALED